MDKHDIESYKAEFIDLLKSTGREGIDDLIEMLEDRLNRDSVIIATLLHDICKADIYSPAIKKQPDPSRKVLPKASRNVPASTT